MIKDYSIIIHCVVVIILLITEYHFTTREEMTKAIAAGEFIKSAEYSGNMYGTRYDEFDKQFYH